MTYASVEDLLRRAAASELAEAAAPDAPDVDGDLLKAYTASLADNATGSELDDYSEEDKLAAQQAHAWLEAVLDDAATLIDSRISARYPDRDALSVAALKPYCIDIALWRLFGGESDGERRLAYNDALAWLNEVARGNVDIPVVEVEGEAPAGTGDDILISAPEPVFSGSALDGYLGGRPGRL